MTEVEATTYLHEYARVLDVLAARMLADAPPGRESVYRHWAHHLVQDAKGLYLLGEASARPTGP